MIDRHLKTAQVCELLGVCDETLFRARDRGELTPVRFGRDLHWPVPQLERWLDAHRQDHHSNVTRLRRRTG